MSLVIIRIIRSPSDARRLCMNNIIKVENKYNIELQTLDINITKKNTIVNKARRQKLIPGGARPHRMLILKCNEYKLVYYSL